MFIQVAPVDDYLARSISAAIECAANVESANWYGLTLEVTFVYASTKGTLLYAVGYDIERVLCSITGRSAIDGADLLCAMAGFDEDLMLAVRDAERKREAAERAEMKVEVLKFQKEAT